MESELKVLVSPSAPKSQMWLFASEKTQFDESLLKLFNMLWLLLKRGPAFGGYFPAVVKSLCIGPSRFKTDICCPNSTLSTGGLCWFAKSPKNAIISCPYFRSKCLNSRSMPYENSDKYLYPRKRYQVLRVKVWINPIWLAHTAPTCGFPKL